MKKKTNFIKKIIFSATLALAMIFSSGVGLARSIFSSTKSAYAAYTNESSISFTNNDFTNTSGSSSSKQPYTPSSGWTLSGDSTVNMGIISVSESDFKTTNYGLKENPSRDSGISSKSYDYKILMFKSKDNTPSRAQATSDAVTLSKNSFYKISILAKTMEGALGSITATVGDKTFSFTNVNTTTNGDSRWQTYTYYIATDFLTSSTSLTLTLGFGSNTSKTTGAVFFDNISAVEIDEDTFEKAEEDIYTKKVDFLQKQRQALQTINFESEALSADWERTDDQPTSTILDIYSTSSINQLIREKFNNTDTDIAMTNVANNTKSLLFINTEEETKKITTLDTNTFTIKQFGLYQLSILYKTGDVSGTGLNVKVYDKDEPDTYYKEQTNLTGSSSLANYNGFSLATFYIKGDTIKDRELMMDISFGNGTGWAIVDDIKLYPIITSEYSSTNEINYTSNLKTSGTLSNERFDLVTIESLDQSNGDSYPATPTSWTFVGEDNGVKSGIIRVNPENFNTDSDSFGGVNPGYDKSFKDDLPSRQDNYNENVLMVRNESTGEVYYESSSVTVSSNTSSTSTYSSFTIGVKAINGNKAFARIVDKNGNVIGEFKNITTDDATSTNKWKKLTFYVYNGVTEQSLKVQIGSSNGNSYVYFDNVIFTKSLSTAPTDSEQKAENTLTINLSTNDFVSQTGFTGYNKETTSYNFSNVGISNPREDATDSYVLKIDNNPKTYQKLISNYTYALSKDKYYEFSVWVKTNFDTENNTGDYGANIEIVTLDSDSNVVANDENKNKFVNIVTDSDTNDGWVKYSIYILAESSQNVKVTLGVGTEEQSVYGSAYFDDLTVKEIAKADYTEIEANATTIVSTVVEPETDDDNNTDETDDSATQTEDINVWMLVSSILLVIALILAIIGYYIRRIPRNKEVKVNKKEYNKEKDKVDAVAIKENLKTQNEENLAKLKSEIEELEAQYNTLKQEYEEKTKDKDTIDQKIYANYTKKANKLISEIDYLKSAVAYLNDPLNVKSMEKREIKRSQKELDKKNLELNLTTTVEETQEEKIETPKKKTRKKLQKFN